MDSIPRPYERRVHNRYKLQEGAFAAPWAPVRKLWQILDISHGGLAFRYIPYIQEISESGELEITTRDVGFSLEKIPYRSVSEKTFLKSVYRRIHCAAAAFDSAN
jgi:hypothetical protein